MKCLFRILLFLNIVLACWIVWDKYNYDPRPPIERWIKVEVLNSPIFPGESLWVRIHRIKIRDDCIVASDRQAIDSNGRVVNLPNATWEGGNAEDTYLEYLYELPKDIHGGVYVLRVFLTYTCPGFVWTTQQPDATFTVLETQI